MMNPSEVSVIGDEKTLDWVSAEDAHPGNVVDDHHSYFSRSIETRLWSFHCAQLL